MKIRLFIILFLLIVQTGFAQDKPKEQIVIDRVWNSIGGREKWELTRYIKFTFLVEQDTIELARREHVWDRYTGAYRINLTQKDAKKLQVLFNINTKEGKSYVDSVEQNDSVNIKILERAYKYFINDTYWLLVPAKLEDPGVNVKALEDTTINEISCNVLQLTFGEDIGLTPKDQYWLYVNEKTGQIIRWSYLLQGDTEITILNWEPYINTGELSLCAERIDVNENFSIKFPVIETSKMIDETIFNEPNGLD